jgi:hypothetical protein
MILKRSVFLGICFFILCWFMANVAAASEEKKFKRKQRTGLRITEPKQVTGPTGFSCYPGKPIPTEKNELMFSLNFDEPEKCKESLNSATVAGESKTLKRSAEGRLSGTCLFSQMVKLDFGPDCKFTLNPLIESSL